MGHPLEVFMKHLLRETKAGEVAITEDNASSEMPVPNLMLMSDTASTELIMSSSLLEENSSSSSLDTMLNSSGGSRWDSVPSMGACEQKKKKRERIPSIPRRSTEKDSMASSDSKSRSEQLK
jgi:hypothetical protein